ncbi:hypothetical protein SDC9_103633 [bioreactor metagenome]|uniref:PilZ domain-containing protein n=1 Tax=bioreactor metagenome TaxID=1076179 RepID=A0A645AVM8_9ZZZZ
MLIKCILIDDENEVIDNADLYYLTSKRVILTPYGEDTLKRFKKGQNIRFQFENKYDKVFDGETAEIANGKIILKNVRDIGSILHRDVRVSVDIPSRISYENDEGYYEIEITVKNISSGGMCFVCKENLNMDITYETVVDWIGIPMIVKIELLRKEYDEQNMDSYGCKFIDLLQEEEFMLRAGVYDIQAKKYKPRRSNVSNEYC